PSAWPARLLRVGLGIHGGVWIEELLDRPKPESDREGLRPEQFHPRQLPCARLVRHERRAHRQTSLGCAWHGDRNQSDEKLRGQPPQSLARTPNDLTAGDRPAPIDSR